MFGGLRSKKLMFVATMAALSNVLSFVSIQLAPIIPSIPLGPVTVSLALDFSHLATFIAALFGGPLLGGLTGLIGGMTAAFEFGFSKGNLVTGLGLPLGKAMTGLAAGLVMPTLCHNPSSLRTVASTVVSFVPEGVFTAFLFITLYPIFYGMPTGVAKAVTVQILVKAIFEMIVMGFILTGLLMNRGFTEYMNRLLT